MPRLVTNATNRSSKPNVLAAISILCFKQIVYIGAPNNNPPKSEYLQEGTFFIKAKIFDLKTKDNKRMKTAEGSTFK